MLFITIFFSFFFFFTNYHTLLHNAGALFHVILNDLIFPEVTAYILPH